MQKAMPRVALNCSPSASYLSSSTSCCSCSSSPPPSLLLLLALLFHTFTCKSPFPFIPRPHVPTSFFCSQDCSSFYSSFSTSLPTSLSPYFIVSLVLLHLVK